MSLLPERDEGTNFWPVYSDLAMVMVLLLLLFVLIQFVVNSKTLIHEAELVASAQDATNQRDTNRRLIVQLTLELEEARRHIKELEALLARSEGEVKRQGEALAALSQLTLELEEARRHIKELEALLARSEGEVKRQGEALATLSRKDAEMIKTKEKLSKRQDAIANALQGERGIQGMRIDGNLQLFTFSADALFPPDDANLSPQGEDLLHRFAQVLQQHPEYYTRIEVEGHADENPSTYYYHKKEDFEDDHGNWRLSAERAITVIQLFQKRGIPGPRLGVVGRSRYDPVANERSREALAQNRRVQVRLFYSEVTP